MLDNGDGSGRILRELERGEKMELRGLKGAKMARVIGGLGLSDMSRKAVKRAMDMSDRELDAFVRDQRGWRKWAKENQPELLFMLRYDKHGERILA